MSIIAAVEGMIEGKTADAALVRVGGVTFRVHVPSHDLAGLPPTGHVRLLTHLIVREDDLQLYGFAEDQGRRLFEALLSVNGVGPKAALAVLSVLSPADLAAAIVSGDATAISRAQGVGKRTAERIILELKGKLEEEFGPLPVRTAVGPSAATVADPALQWLLGLGFSAIEARQALGVEPDEGLSVDERVRRALQRMGRGGD
jgi:holliday junction DNA helicase RuvA